jgi:gamma-glutamylcyclotransferase (GGCT)/AIG2-like uncharacterized protein YtfP
MSTPGTLLFVYGSLRRGQQHHAELRDARLIDTVRTEACYELVDLGPYPALLEGGNDAVVGELYEVSASLIEELDLFEEVPEMYRRVPLRIAGVDAHGYVLPRERAGDAPRVPSGDWCKR